MQNKPNPQDAQMNINLCPIQNYKNRPVGGINPIQTQTNPISKKPKINLTSIVTKDYQNMCPCGVPKNKPKTNPMPT